VSEGADLSAIEAPGRRPRDPLGILTDLLAAIGTVWTFLLMLLIVADVVGRSFLNAPITGVAEIAAHSIVAIVFLQLSAAVHAGRMTRADFLIERVVRAAPRLGRVLEALFLLIGAAVMLFIAMAAWPGFVGARAAGEFFGVQGLFTVPTWPFRAIIVGGAALAAFAYLAAAARMLVAGPPRH
jgi:TRAP-type C4-dicarboxylate transport system permease small subunit